jgi:hypothetical protein
MKYRDYLKKIHSEVTETSIALMESGWHNDRDVKGGERLNIHMQQKMQEYLDFNKRLKDEWINADSEI